MSRVHEALRTGNIPSGWRIITPDESILGPVSEAQLQTWAAEGRIAPGSRISSDGETWSRVEDMPELHLEWMAYHDNAPAYGPFHVLAVPNLVRQGILSADSTLRHLNSDKTMRVNELLKTPDSGAAAAVPAKNEDELRAWRRREAELENQVGLLAEQRDKLQSKFDDFTKKADTDQADNAERLDALTKECEKWRTEAAALQTELGQLQERLKENENQNYSREKQAHLRENKLNSELQTLRTLLENTRRNQEQTARDKEQKLTETEARIKQIEHEKEALQQDAELRANALAQDISGLQNENRLLNQQLSGLRDENKELRRLNTDIEAEMQERIERTEREIEALRAADAEQQDDGRDEEISKLQSTIEKLEEQRQSEAVRYNEETEALRLQQEKITRENDRLAEELRNSHAELERQQQADAATRLDREKQQAVLEAAREKEASLTEQLSRAREQSTALIAAAREQHEKEIRSLRGELARLRSRNCELENEVTTAGNTIQQSKNRLEQEQKERQQTENKHQEEYQALSTELQNVQAALNAEQQEKLRIEEIRGSLENELKKTQDGLDNAHEAISRLEADLRRRQKEIDRIRREHETILPGAGKAGTASERIHHETGPGRRAFLMVILTIAVIAVLWSQVPVIPEKPSAPLVLPPPVTEPLRTSPEKQPAAPKPEQTEITADVPTLEISGATTAAFGQMLRVSFGERFYDANNRPAPGMMRRLYYLSEAVGPLLDGYRLVIIDRASNVATAHSASVQKAEKLRLLLIEDFGLPPGRLVAGNAQDFDAPVETAAYPPGIEFWLIP